MGVKGTWRQDDGRWESGNPGDWWFAVTTEGVVCNILFRCPHCGDIRHADLSQGDFYKVGERPYWWWNKNREAPTLKPSLHLKDRPPGVPRDKAGPISGWPTHWHGWLTDGNFS